MITIFIYFFVFVLHIYTRARAAYSHLMQRPHIKPAVAYDDATTAVAAMIVAMPSFDVTNRCSSSSRNTHFMCPRGLFEL